MKPAKIVLLEEHLTSLLNLVFDQPGKEGAAFVLCGESTSLSLDKLLSHEVVPILDEDFLRRESHGLSIRSHALVRIAKRAQRERLAVIFVHSHPDGAPHFSSQDDREEERLLPFLFARVRTHLHGTLVLTRDTIAGRVYTPDRNPADVLVIGDRIRLYNARGGAPPAAAFDRQVRAFGSSIQATLRDVHVGVVGVGGTGSAVGEHLCRLGVGSLSLIDGDSLEATNVTRVYGSSIADEGTPKVDVASAHLARIGLGTKIRAIPKHITAESAAKALRECDVVFGCTDKQLPRAILVELALRYHIPVFDLGVKIDSLDGHLRGVYGRVTTLLAGEACMWCRGRITTATIRAEALSPDEHAAQVREGYAPELDERAPAVIAFTSATASYAVTELLHRLTGFMGDARRSSEVLLMFDQSIIRTNRVAPEATCVCSDRDRWGRGDQVPYLGLMWPASTT
jgi:molybdopterin/thiamine biosynthesis adenylyltransferase